LLHKALKLARQLEDPEYVVTCRWSFLGWIWPPQYQLKVFEIARESADSPVPDVSPKLRGEFLGVVAKYLIASGDGDRASRVSDESVEYVERTNIPLLRTLLLAGEIKTKTSSGQLESAVETTDRLIVRSWELGSAAVGLQMAATRGFIPLLYLGRVDDALALIPQAGRNVGLEAEVPSSRLLPEFSSVHALCHAHADRLTEAHENFNLAMAWIEESLAERCASVTDLLILLETAVLLKDVGVANRLADQLEVIAGSPGIARRLGEAAALSGKWNKAQEYFHKAMEVSINTRDHPETALSRFDMAELLLGRYPGQRDEAMEHVEFAIAEFRDTKMQPALERALALNGWAESAPAAASPDGLTHRESEVLRHIAVGGSNRDIANELVLSVRTVERHINNIYRKIDARGRADAVAYALRHDMDDCPEPYVRIYRNTHKALSKRLFLLPKIECSIIARCVVSRTRQNGLRR
jgi:DNA-binding CsgD family transcriptional regulator